LGEEIYILYIQHLGSHFLRKLKK